MINVSDGGNEIKSTYPSVIREVGTLEVFGSSLPVLLHVGVLRQGNRALQSISDLRM